MPRYELIEGGEHGSRKFWEISIEGTSIVRRWGRIGAKGQTKRNDFRGTLEAQAEYGKLIAEKRGKGYELVEGTGIERAPEAKPVRTASNPELEAAIEDDPNDEQAWLVYGDWLQSQGDPRGELIALQIAMRRPGITPTEFLPLKKQESELLHDHKAHFQGGIESEPYGFALDWRYGYVYRVVTDMRSRAKLSALLDHPSGRFLQDVHVTDEELLGELLARKRPRSLRRLSIAFREEIARLGDVAAAFPKLERLVLRGEIVMTEGVRFPDLKWLQVEGSLDEGLLRSRFPSLETLSIHPFGYLGGRRPKVPLAALLEDSDRFPKLVTLMLGAIGDADGFLARLANAPILSRLVKLEIAAGTEEGARTIVRARDRFAHLQTLKLGTSVPRALHDELRKVCKNVDVGLSVNIAGDPVTGPRGEERRRYEPVRE